MSRISVGFGIATSAFLLVLFFFGNTTLAQLTRTPVPLVIQGPTLCPDCTFALELTGTNLEAIPQKLQADFDGDGIMDWVEASTYSSLVTVHQSQRGPYVFLASSPRTVTGATLVSLRSDGRFPSIVISLSTYEYDVFPQGFFHSTEQHIILNENGFLRDFPLSGVNGVARNVDCTRPLNQDAICFFPTYAEMRTAPYPSTNPLVKINSAGSPTVINSQVGLPFPMNYNSPSKYPYVFRTGAVFIDLNRDGLDDLYSVAQHGPIFTALGAYTPQLSYRNFSYHGAADEYIKASAAKGWEIPRPLIPPCVYVSIENSSPNSDFVECYNRKSAAWYRLTIPGGPYRMNWQSISFYPNGKVSFAIQNTSGNWNELALRCIGTGCVRGGLEDITADNRIIGYALDHNRIESPSTIEIHFRARGAAVEDTIVISALANAPNTRGISALNLPYPHGFNVPVPQELLNGEQYIVDVYVVATDGSKVKAAGSGRQFPRRVRPRYLLNR